MSFKVIIQPRALRDLDDGYQYLADCYSVKSAINWYNGFLIRLKSLEKNPLRFGFARESRQFENDIRQILYRRHKNVHRALYVVEDDIVRILCIRHSAQSDVKPEDLSGE